MTRTTDEAALRQLGWGPEQEAYFEAYREDLEQRHEALTPSRVSRVDLGECTVTDGANEVRAAVSRRLFSDAVGALGQPAVGDWVVHGVGRDVPGAMEQVLAILPRKTAFTRRAPGGRTVEQVVAANLDTVFVVAALVGPQRLQRVERYVALAWQSGAEPVVLLSKADVCDDLPGALAEARRVAVGCEVHAISALHDTGLTHLEPYLGPGRTVTLVGPSGVGKSTLVNRLCGSERLATQEIRSDGKGRHTTTHREMVLLPSGGMLIDTPGMRALAAWDLDEGIDGAFSDIVALAAECQFADCGHHGEPGCAVASAIASGELEERRLDHFEKLQREQRWLDLRQDSKARAEDKKRIRTRAKALKKRPHRWEL